MELGKQFYRQRFNTRCNRGEAYGERKDNALLTARISQIEEYDAWQLTALACELNNQQGVPWNCGAYFGIYDIW